MSALDSDAKIAALYVQTNGCYYDLEGIDPWDIKRDARLYQGPYPVIAHPPCKRWGRYWFGSPSSTKRFKKGEDRGCFGYALRAVRKFGGVIEHPAYSYAWEFFHLNKPPVTGGWITADYQGGWTCHVEQGHYGHDARKSTWLYAVGVDLPSLTWGVSRAKRKATTVRTGAVGMMSQNQRAATPIPFRDLLIEMARSCYERT